MKLSTAITLGLISVMIGVLLIARPNFDPQAEGVTQSQPAPSIASTSTAARTTASMGTIQPRPAPSVVSPAPAATASVARPSPTSTAAAREALAENRANCVLIRASDYRSAAEREWFLANCLAPSQTVAATQGAPAEIQAAGPSPVVSERVTAALDLGPPVSSPPSPIANPVSFVPPADTKLVILGPGVCEYGVGSASVTCAGFVMNVTGELLPRVEAVVTFYIGSSPVRSGSAVVGPLAAGNGSAFSVSGPYDPGYTAVLLEFRDQSGTPLRHVERPN